MSTLSVNSIKDVQSFDFANTSFASAFGVANSGYVVANAAFTYGNSSYTVANAAFAKANTALQNTSGVFAGNLGMTGSLTLTGSVVGGSARTIPSTGGYFIDVTGINTDIVANGRTAAITGGWGSLRVHQAAGHPGLKLVGDTSQTANYMEVESSTGSTLYRITSAGKVSIGTSSAGQQYLTVGTSNGETGINLVEGSTNGRTYELITGGSGGAFAGGAFGVYDRTAGAVRMLINSSGHVTKPYQPRFKAVFSTATDTSYTINTILPYNTSVYNVGTHYNTSTYRFTAPVAGYYYFRAWGYATASAGARATMSIRLYKNGSQDSSTVTGDINIGSTAAGEVSIAGLNSYGTLYLNAGDYVEAYCTAYNNNSTFRIYTGHAGFEGYLLG